MTGPAVVQPAGYSYQGTPTTITPPLDMRYVPPAPAQPENQPAGAPPIPATAPAPAPQPTQQPPAPAGLPIPPELKGKSAEEQLAQYMRLRQHYEQTANMPSAPAPREAMPAAPAAAPTAADFWSNPVAVMQQVIDARLAPVVNNTQLDMATKAQATIAGLPGAAELTQDIMGIMQNVDRAALGDPNIWRNAYSLALGQAIAGGRQIPGINAPAPTVPVPTTVTTLPAGMTPTLQPNGFQPTLAFFTEPTRTSSTPAEGLTAQQLATAAKMNMSPDQYKAWGGK